MDEKWWPKPPDSFFHSLAESRHALALVEYYPTELTEHAAPKVLGISKLVHPSINVIALSVEKSRVKKGVVAFQHYDGSWHFQASAVERPIPEKKQRSA